MLSHTLHLYILDFFYIFLVAPLVAQVTLNLNLKLRVVNVDYCFVFDVLVATLPVATLECDYYFLQIFHFLSLCSRLYN